MNVRVFIFSLAAYVTGSAFGILSPAKDKPAVAVPVSDSRDSVRPAVLPALQCRSHSSSRYGPGVSSAFGNCISAAISLNLHGIREESLK